MIQLPRSDDFNATWNFVRAGIQAILIEPLDSNHRISPQMYMGIYSAIHNFCVSLSSSQSRSMTGELSRGAEFRGVEIYDKLREYLKDHLNNLYNQSLRYKDEALIKFYIKSWIRYTTGARYLNNIFEYINRHWVKRQREEGAYAVYDVNTLCLVLWKLYLFAPIKDSLVCAVLYQIEKQRNGETIETMDIKTITQSFVSLGLDESDPKKVSLSVYNESFQDRFIKATHTYYTNESNRFVSQYSVVDYMKKAQARLEEERGRVEMFLHPSTEGRLMRTCEYVLIENHADLLWDEFEVLLENDRQEDLQRMYQLLSLINKGNDNLKAQFEEYVKKQGLMVVNTLVNTNVESKDTTPSKPIDVNPKTYVDALLATHTKYSALVKSCFNFDAEFVKSLDNACKEYINRNAVCASNSSKSPELLAKYTDLLLRKNSGNTNKNSPATAATTTASSATVGDNQREVAAFAGTDTIKDSQDDLESKLDGIMIIFRYVDDKDVFQKFYTRMISKRLVCGTSISEDAESSMISKLKDVCGLEYTSKLQRMFQDMSISTDLQTEFKEYVAQNNIFSSSDADFQMLVLANSVWPLSQLQTDFILPPELSLRLDVFEKFYGSKHNGRVLNWLWNLSKGEIKLSMQKKPNVKGPNLVYTFTVSAFQIAILLAYNDADSYTFEELKSITKLTPDYLSQAITVIVRARVLLKIPEDAAIDDDSTVFKFNSGFKSKRMRINLNMPLRAEQKQETAITHKYIEEDRKMLIQAVIVRIMKARRKLKHVQLVQETISQVSSRFNPKVTEIKKCIEYLIEKEYIERADNDLYSYVA